MQYYKITQCGIYKFHKICIGIRYPVLECYLEYKYMYITSTN